MYIFLLAYSEIYAYSTKRATEIKEAEEQKWLGAYTNKQRLDKQLPSTANQILKKWKNIPGIVYSVKRTIHKQPLPTKHR